MQIYASQFVTQYFILLPFVLLNLENLEREKLQKIEYLEKEKSFFDELKNSHGNQWPHLTMPS